MNPQAPPLPPPPQSNLPPSAAPSPLGPEQQIVEQLKSATNVLVTVSVNPSVDQLAAAIGLTLVLNKLGKHATAVFSGKVPSTIEFLQPEKTLEKNTDSLRDFIIALDKSKADKLRYKVEDKFVKIFITPYHTSLSEKDVEFSQGDFNVDDVVALGVKSQGDLDQAITAHGRILHDAAVMSINHIAGGNLGAVNLNQPDTSSLCEILVGLAEKLQPEGTKVIDAQIANAFLTGIVAETERFSNNKTKPQTMSTAARLMDAGANQQLVASKLEEPEPIPREVNVPPKPPQGPKLPPSPPKPTPPPPPPPAPHPTPTPKATAAPPKPKEEEQSPLDGSLLVPHEGEDEYYDDNIEKIHIDDQGTLQRLEELRQAEAEAAAKKAASPQPAASPAPPAMNLPPVPPVPQDDETLTQIEASVHSKHLQPAPTVTPGPPSPQIKDTKAGGTLPDGQPNLPTQLVGPDKGLPPDKTAGSPNPSPPPVPPPFMVPPPAGQGTAPDSGAGVPL